MKKLGLTTKVLIALLIGIIVGIIVFNLPESTVKNAILIDGIFHFIGQIFLRGIMMLVVPLVFISLVNGSASMGDIKKLSRIGGKTIGFYLTTTALAIIIALCLGYLLQPGVGLDLAAVDGVDVEAAEAVPLVDTFIEMVPNNIFDAFVNGNMLQVIVFAILTGIGMSLMGEKARFLLDLFENLNDLMMKLINIVMTFAPIGVFGLIARTFATVGYSAMLPLLKYIAIVYLGLILHAGLVYSGMFKMFTKLSIGKFFKKFSPAMSVAFSTASSNATIPVSLDICEKKLGTNRDIAAFTIPLGATINMDGTAIMQGVAAFFVAQVYDIPMTLTMMITIVLTATLASIGTAGVPGAGAIMLSMVLQSVGLPLEGIGLIMGVDRLVDMARTSINVTGDAVCTSIIAFNEKELDVDVFNQD